MMTEKGTIQTSTVLDDKMQKELSQNTHRLAALCIVIGIIGVIVFAVFQIVSFFIDFADEDFYFILVVFALFLGMGFYLQYALGKGEEAVRAANKTVNFEFYKNCFTTIETANGQTVANTTINLSVITKVKETKNYLFLFVNAASAYPVFKGALSEEELNTLKSILNMPFTGNVTELASYNPDADENRVELSSAENKAAVEDDTASCGGSANNAENQEG